MENNLITIIVPIFNVEKYLPVCIESILKQTIKELEILLINDGSTDHSLEICKEYEKKDKRIKVINNKKNKGLSETRNIGIKKAHGNYLAFIDGDDYIAPTFIEKLYEELIKNNADISVCNFYYVDENNRKWIRKEKPKHLYTSFEAIKDIFTHKQDLDVIVCNKLYKKELFQTIKFPEVRMHEDHFVMYKLFYSSKTICSIPDKLYYYVQRKSSITNTYADERLDILKVLDEIRIFFKGQEKYTKLIECNELTVFFSVINLILIYHQKNNILNDIQEKLKKRIPHYLLNAYIPFYKKLQLLTFCIHPKCYECIYKFLK